MNCRKTAWAFLGCLLFAMCMPIVHGNVYAEQSPPVVLILNSYHQGETWSDNEIAGIIPTLQTQYPELIPSIENLDTKRFPSPDYLQFMQQYLEEKYRGKQVDLLIVLDNPALEMILAWRNELFPGVPVVFAGINGFQPEMLAGQEGITGVAETQDFAGTIDLALALNPDVKRVYAIHDYTDSGLAVRNEMEAILPEYSDRVEITFSPDVSYKELEDSIRNLPADSVVLIMTYVTDAIGRTFTRAESTRLISSLSPVPVYAMHETRLGYGIVGGRLLEGLEHGRQAAELALRVLNGGNPSDLPVEKSTSHLMLDYQVLSKFHLSEKHVPSGAAYINKPVSWWEENKGVLLPILGITGGLVMVVLLLSWMLIRIRQAQHARHEIETRLAESNRVMQAILEHTHIMAVLLDPQFNFIWVNQAYAATCRQKPSFFSGKNHFDLYPNPENQVIFQHVIESGESYFATAKPFEFPEQPDRGITYWDWSLIPVSDETGKITSLVFTLSEVTRRIKAEESLRQSEEKFRTIAEQSSDMIALTDTNGTITYASPASLVLFGLDPQDMIGKNFIEFLDESTQGKAFTAFRNTIEKLMNYKNLELLLKRTDGSRFYGELNGTLVHTGSIQGTLVLIRDITNRKRAEERLRVMAAMLDVAPSSITIHDRGGKFHYVNQKTYQIHGYDKNEFMELSLFQLNTPENNALAEERFQQIEKEGGAAFRASHFRKDGTTLPLEIVVRKVNWEGEPAFMSVATDISERIHAEDALRESEKKYRILIETAGEAIFVVQGGIIKFVNASTSKITGFTKEELISAPIINFIHPEDSNLVFRRHTQRLQGMDVPSTYSFRIVHASGKIRWVELSAVVIEWEGKPATLNFLTDVTERKLAEEALRESEAKFALAFHSSPYAITITRLSDGKIIDVNDGFFELSEYSYEEVKDKTTLELNLWADEQERAEVVSALLKEGSISGVEFHFRKKSGEIFPGLFSAGLITFREEKCVLSSINDITMRKRAEEALRESEARFRNLFEHSPVAYQSLNEQGCYIDVNDELCTLLGYPREELIGKEFGEYWSPETKDRFTKLFNIFTKKGTIRGELELVRKNGEHIDVILEGRIQKDTQGEFVRTHCVLYNITQRKRAEQILQTRLRLILFAGTHTLEELLQATLDEIEELTGSNVGFYHFVEDDQITLSLQAWSTNTLENMCTAEGKGEHYPVDQAGVWVDCIHQRGPVIHNDYAALPHRKGTPQGHAPIIRELVVPIFRGETIKAIVGVGNKPVDYNQDDLKTTSTLADLAWDIVERMRAEEALKQKITELERFNNLTIDRELRMIDLKKEINALLKQSGQPEKYRIVK